MYHPYGCPPSCRCPGRGQPRRRGRVPRARRRRGGRAVEQGRTDARLRAQQVEDHAVGEPELRLQLCRPARHHAAAVRLVRQLVVVAQQRHRTDRVKPAPPRAPRHLRVLACAHRGATGRPCLSPTCYRTSNRRRAPVCGTITAHGRTGGRDARRAPASSGRKSRPSCLRSEWKTTVRAGAFTPIANVSVLNSTCANPKPQQLHAGGTQFRYRRNSRALMTPRQKSSSTSSFTIGSSPAWCTPSPRLSSSRTRSTCRPVPPRSALPGS